MTTSELSKTYARILFDLASAADIVDKADEDLRTIATTVADNVELREALNDEAVASEAKRGVIGELFANCAPEVVALATLSIERAGIESLFALQKEYVEISERERGIVVVEVTTAMTLDDATRTSLIDKLAASLGRPVTLRETVDPAVIGGIRISVAGRVLDGTISSQLTAVRNALSNASQGGEV